jgi:hypothetical protein
MVIVQRVRITEAQYSALECAGLDEAALTPTERALKEAWLGTHLLTLRPETLKPILSALTDAINSEDACAEDISLDKDIRRLDLPRLWTVVAP